MGSFISLPVLVLAVVLQVTVVPQFSYLGGRPDLVLLFVMAWTLNSSLEEGVVWAFVGGILNDLLSAMPTGASVFGMVILVFAIHLIRRQIYRVSIISLVWITLLGSFFHQLSLLVIMLLTGFQAAGLGRFGIGVLASDLTYVIFPTMVYNLLVIFPVYWIVRRIQKRVGREKPFFS
jgi:rod shape-determining protein MreD